MSVARVATWNAEGMFVKGTLTRRADPHDALKALRELDADIVVVPEFGKISQLEETVANAIKSLGYELIINPYNDPRAPGLGFGFFSRLPIVRQRTFGLPVTDRTILEVYCRDEAGHDLRVVGVHLDDRAEAIRMREIAKVVNVINGDIRTPTLLMGDFNAMPAASKFARLTRSQVAAVIAQRIPHAQLSHVAQRVREMAIGTTIEYLLAHTSLRNLDLKLAPTISAKQRGMEWAPRVRLAKIDWIFGSSQIEVTSHAVKKDVGSDHRQVVAEIIY